MSFRWWTIGTLTIAASMGAGIALNARENSHATQIVETAIDSLERKAPQEFDRLLAANVRFDNIFTLPDRPVALQGREAVSAHIEGILSLFEQFEFAHKRFYATQDDRTVFIEARGDFIVQETGAPYRNTYVFAIEVNNDRITAIREYNRNL